MDFTNGRGASAAKIIWPLRAGLALITEADRAVGPIQLREHKIVTERVRMAALGQHVVMTTEPFGTLIELVDISQHANSLGFGVVLDPFRIAARSSWATGS